MNRRVLDRLCTMFQSSPQLLDDNKLLQQAINGTFGVNIKGIEFTNVKDLTELIHYHVLKKYFTTTWQPITKKYKYSGLSIIDEVNSLNPLKVLDLGCGYNEFKGKINNLIGVDPYNERADVNSSHHSASCLGAAVLVLASYDTAINGDQICEEIPNGRVRLKLRVRRAKLGFGVFRRD